MTTSITEIESSVAELYIAYFNRAPEAAGLNYWTQQVIGSVDKGQSIDAALSTVSAQFYDIGIALGVYSSSMSAEDFVISVYKNVLGRDLNTESAANKEEALNAWVPTLTTPNANATFISTLIATAKGYQGDPQWGWVADYLAARTALGLEFAKPEYSSALSSADAITKGKMALEFTSPVAIKAGQTAAQAVSDFDEAHGDITKVSSNLSANGPLKFILDAAGTNYDTLDINVSTPMAAGALTPAGTGTENFKVVNIIAEAAGNLTGTLNSSAFGSAAQEIWQIGKATDIAGVTQTQAAGFRNISGSTPEEVSVSFSGATGTIALDHASSAQFTVIDTPNSVNLDKVVFAGASGGYLNLGSGTSALVGTIGLPQNPTIITRIGDLLLTIEGAIGNIGANLQNSGNPIGSIFGGVILGVNGIAQQITEVFSNLSANIGKGPFSGGLVSTGIHNGVSLLGTLTRDFSNMVSGFIGQFTGFVGNIGGAMAGSTNPLISTLGSIIEVVNGLTESVESTINTVINQVTSGGSLLGGLTDGVITGVKEMLSLVTALAQNVEDQFQGSTGLVGQIVGGVASLTSGLLSQIDSVISQGSGSTAPTNPHPALPSGVSELDMALTDATDIRLYDSTTLSKIKTIDASKSTGDLKLHLETVYSASLTQLKLGSGNDQLTMSTDNLTQSSLTVNAGAGNDSIVTLLNNVAENGVSKHSVALTITGGSGDDTFGLIGGNISTSDIQSQALSNLIAITDFGNGSDTLLLSSFTGFVDQKTTNASISKLSQSADLFDALNAVSNLTKNGLFSNKTADAAHFVFHGDTYIYVDPDHNSLDAGDLVVKLAGIVAVDNHVAAA